MHQICKVAAVAAMSISAAEAFVGPASSSSSRTVLLPSTAPPRAASASAVRINRPTRLRSAEDDDKQDSEIERLKEMAAKLRAEAASLEAEKARQLADAAEKAFKRFDVNSDGEVSLSELKTGLERELKVRAYG